MAPCLAPPPVQLSTDASIYFSPITLMWFVRKWRYYEYSTSHLQPQSLSFLFSHKHKPHLSVSITRRLNVEVIFLNTKSSKNLCLNWFCGSLREGKVCVLKHAISIQDWNGAPEVIFSFPDVYLPSVALPMTSLPYGHRWALPQKAMTFCSPT